MYLLDLLCWSFLTPTGLAFAANCKRNGNAVTCDDGRVGIFTGDAIIWPDGTRSTSAQHPSVRIGHKDSGARRSGRVRLFAIGEGFCSARRSETRLTSAIAPCSIAYPYC